MTRRRIAALLTILVGLLLAVQSAQATIDPTVNMSPGSPYTFPSTAVGSTSTKTVTVSNPGPEDEVFSAAPTLTGANPGQFSIAHNTCTDTVVAGSGCSFDVTFAPTASAAASAAVQFSGTPAIANYQVSGTGTPGGTIGVSPSSLDFGGVKLNTTSAGKTVTVTNTGSDNVTLGSIVASQATYAVGGGCSGTVLAKNGGSCTITVTLTPTSTGAQPADLTIPYTGATDVSKVVSLTGTGTQPQVAFTPSTGVSFAIGIGDTTAPQTLSIKNSGDAQMNISAITLAGTDAARFAISSKTCGATLAAGATCTVSVTFTPNAAGVFNATLHMADDALSNPHDANLTGTATVPGVQTTPTSLTFPSQQDGTLGTTMQVTVKNTSATASLKVGTLSIGGTNPGSFIFAANGDVCSGATIAPGATCTARITFRPAQIGPKSAALVIPSNADATANVALLGTSLAPPPVKGVRGASGCTKANISWTTPTPPRYVKLLIVRSRDHVPETPTDGTVLAHGTGALNDTGLQVTSTYHYSLFTVTNAYDNSSRLIYARPTSITLLAGRVCTPMNGGQTRDLTPLIDWASFTKGSSYGLRLTNSAGKTILVRYTTPGTTRYQVPSRWQYGGSSHKLVHGTTYTVYVYAYNEQYPVGRWIGQSRWTEK